jgi:uncharacterized delta-60 repeat protein
VYSLALQSDEKILVGGTFTTMAGAAQTNLARLNSDGTLDPSFNATTLGLPDVLLVQPDGKILVGGDFFNTPVGVNYCRRLNADGGLDTTFNSVLTDAAFPSVYALALQTDGSILIGGIFDTLGGVPRSNFGRLSKDGSTDLNFDPGGGAVHSLALQPDGRVLFGSPTDLGRLLNTDPATDDLSFDNSSVTWTRSGSAPEVWYVAFEVTTNGEDWLNLGRGTRITGGWQSTGRSLPSPPAIIRARGFVTGGNWFDEKLAGPPIITSQPASMTVNAVTRVNFSVAVTGPVPLTYQWLKNGTNFDPENGSGAQSPYLTLTNLLGSDSGQYQLVVSDSWGSVTSLVANLVVKDPILTSQPSGFATNVGQTVVFSVGAAGTLPLIYQWYKNGTALPNSTTSLLALTNIYGSDAANYFAIVTNQYGARTSSIVSLSVNLALPDTFGPNPGIVSALAVQGDGKILLAPNSPATDQIFTRSPLRYNFDGSLDSTFDAGISNRAVNCLMIQTDGKILVAGSPLDSAHYLWRLNVDGSVDTAFTNSAPQLSGPPNSLALQPDGKILLGGNFSIGTPAICTNLARLNPDGTLDSNFLAGANGPV